MSEIEKMYENAGIKPFKSCEFCTQKSVDCLKENISNITCGLSSDEYPPFTAEKQIELIKWLIRYDAIYINYNNNKYNFNTLYYYGEYKKDFEEALASVINNELWQDLTEEEKQQIKEILE